MNPDQLITKAIRCLNTGQPNMAKLYLRKADQLVKAHRKILRAELRECKYRRLEAAGQAVPAALARIVDSWRDMTEILTGTFTKRSASIQSNYALAAPAARP